MYLAVFFTNKECETCWFFGVMYWTGDQEVHQFLIVGESLCCNLCQSLCFAVLLCVCFINAF